MKEIKRIDIISALGSELCSVQNPAVYIGGECGIVKKDGDLFNFAIAFPDVYQIGMSNQAVKIIYNALNKIPSVRCERVFAVESDFASLLKNKNLPLCTLETGIALSSFDIVGFSIGYELGITSVLSMLDLGGIPLLKNERRENDPIVIAGGCGCTNPAPFSDFFDAFFIGEAEYEMFDLIETLAEMKKNGANRSEILFEMSKNPHIWTENMSKETCGHEKAFRAVWADFGKVPSVSSFLPLPSVKPVQNHGVVEIMRGCPNGCRFCHAGIYYRPQRAKSFSLIQSEVERLVEEGGYREISLTSLSSADYPNIELLLDKLNESYKNRNVSFQLPSLKVNSFSLPLLEKLSQVRKSSLTFAVETPDEIWQMMLNKEVYAQHLEEIILDAKKRGWNRAKFYFMIGLPFEESAEKSEEKAIVDFMLALQSRTKIQCSVNVGVFVPKPHTPYQWARQIPQDEAEKKLDYIRKNLPRGKFIVGGHDTFSGIIEGLLSRGDKNAGKVILQAYKNGAQLDAWENHLRENQNAWKDAFESADFDVLAEIHRERDKNEKLPWDSVSLLPPKKFYSQELSRHFEAKLTPKCSENCDNKCGVCSTKIKANTHTRETEAVFPKSAFQKRESENIPVMHRAIFAFSKKNGGEFLPHISLVEVFNRAILKSTLPIIFTSGFNPIPRLEFASPLTLGFRSEEEIASTFLFDPICEREFIEKLNENLPEGILIEKCFIFPITNQRRRESLAASLWGNEFSYRFFLPFKNVANFFESENAQKFLEDSLVDFDLSNLQSENLAKIRISFKNDRAFRETLSNHFALPLWKICEVTKKRTFAKNAVTGWTAEFEESYQNQLSNMKNRAEMTIINSQFKEKARNHGNFSGITDYFDLYKKIAAINASLIDQRNRR